MGFLCLTIMITSSYWKDMGNFLRIQELSLPVPLSAYLIALYAGLSTLFGKIISAIIITVIKKAIKAIKPEGFVIHCLKLKYTNEMEKALLNAHGVCYEEYKRKHHVRMKVEKRREQDYLTCKRLVSDLDSKLHI
jgi:hypothetical protein